MARDVAPHGPLLGNELAWAIELLTDKQLRAYRYRREGHAWNWIARRMGTTRQAVIHHVARAETKLGYEQTVTAKQRAPYKSVARRQAEAESAWDAYAAELLAQMPPKDRRRLVRILETSTSDEEARRRLKQRLKHHQRERARDRQASWDEARDEMGLSRFKIAPVDDDHSRAVGELEAERAEDLREMGVERAEDLPADDGKGYDRL